MNKKRLLTAFTLCMFVTVVFTGAVLAGALTSVTESIQYADKPDALGFKAYLPEGCTVVAVEGDGSPAFRQLADGTVEIFWTEVPASPVNFTYKYQGAAPEKVAADVVYRVGGKEVVESR
jgi:hypothetical protein